ncbi:hypothetical protein CKO50_01175 [Pseudoalteromonas sp. HM-SA03]|uniref:DUF5677 domain-containing protein n=1 Tax=Pseudoalteromonas sp. HM-SA03 TaxID=2029678 RepID=UPI000BAE190C|nr:DUF5677 domain-containing protein [Pseudoalteromonas sp. HM-SA03]PAY03167.1 hypothetical protein CKO50_01175 [Pseudoalteromonas sp. HM-SA03]
MEKFISNVKSTISEFESHLKQLPQLLEYSQWLDKLYSALDVNEHEGINFTIQRVQYFYFIERTREFNDSIMSCLVNEQYTSVETLFRVALETTINFMYLIGEEVNERAGGLLDDYIKNNLKKARKWEKFSIETGDLESAKSAKNLRGSMVEAQNTFISSKGNRREAWPNARERFKRTGLEESYVTLYSSSSDSIHSGAEDIFNLTRVTAFPENIQIVMLRAVHAEKASLSVYYAITFQLHALEAACKLFTKLEEGKLLASAEELASKLHSLREIHENHSVSITGNS